MYASQGADAGLGIETAAREKDLDFIALVAERYHLVHLKSELTSPQAQALLKEPQSPARQGTLRNLPGYSVESAESSESGQVLSLRALLPWWNYREPKAG